MHSSLVLKDRNPQQKCKLKYSSKPSERLTLFYLAIISNELFDQKSPVSREGWFPGGDNIRHTDIRTYRLNRPWGGFSGRKSHLGSNNNFFNVILMKTCNDGNSLKNPAFYCFIVSLYATVKAKAGKSFVAQTKWHEGFLLTTSIFMIKRTCFKNLIFC